MPRATLRLYYVTNRDRQQNRKINVVLKSSPGDLLWAPLNSSSHFSVHFPGAHAAGETGYREDWLQRRPTIEKAGFHSHV